MDMVCTTPIILVSGEDCRYWLNSKESMKFQSAFQVSNVLITDNSDELNYRREDPETSTLT